MPLTPEEMEKKLFDLERRIEEIDSKRGTQAQFLPDTIKARFIGEGVRFLRIGASTDLPAEGERDGACYYERNTKILKIWNKTNSAWEAVTLT